MLVASWNVNSIGARLPTIVQWLTQAQPDVACLQEIKCVEEKFPYAALEDMGYTCAVLGQKSYNGVAILSRYPLEDIRRGLPGEPEDQQARYLEAVINVPGQTFRVASIYLPNGNPVPSEKFDYKLRWFRRLIAHAQDLARLEETLILAGDYNVIPRDVDVHDPAAWADDALLQPQSRAAYQALAWAGFYDAYALQDGRAHQYTFWDYQGGAWPKDHGVRIDHLMLSPQAADQLSDVMIHRDARAMDKPSDHVPITARFDVTSTTV